MPDQPDILFVILDSLRKDRVSTYGHDRPTTPTLTTLSKESTLFESAYVPAPWTLPSHCSMFTGRFPSEHGVTNGFTDASLSLPQELPTITERLAERGYRTAGFSNNPWVGKLSDLTRGFDEFVEWNLEISRTRDDGLHDRWDALYSRIHPVLGHATRHPVYALKRRFFTSRLVDRANRWIRRQGDGSAPTFTFLNLMEAHSPYYPPRSAFRELGLDPPNPVEPRIMNMRLLAYLMGKASLGEKRERLLEYYDASARYQDRQFRQLIATLKDEGLYDDLLLVVCSDHGKTLGEFDRAGTPPHYLRDINTNVPLLIKRPGQQRRERVTTPVELVELYHLFDDGGQGHQRNEQAMGREYALVEDHVPHTAAESTSVTRWRTLCGPERKYVRGEAGEEFLLEGSGPQETLVEADREAMAPMARTLEDRVQRLSPIDREDDGGQDLESDVEAQLEDLGYLG